MKWTVRYRRSALLVVLMLTVGGGITAQPKPIQIAPGDLMWMDAPPVISPGVKMALMQGNPSQAEPYAYRLQLFAGFKVMPHRHPGDEHITVLSGTLYMGVGETFDPATAKQLPAGGFLVIPAGTPHFGWAQEESIVQVHGLGPSRIMYVNPADDPHRP